MQRVDPSSEHLGLDTDDLRLEARVRSAYPYLRLTLSEFHVSEICLGGFEGVWYSLPMEVRVL